MFTKNESASSAVEFAILAPVFLMLVIGMLAYGIYFGAAHTVQQLAADAARATISGLSAPERSRIVDDFIERNASAYILIDKRRLIHTAKDSRTDPDQYVVEVSYDASLLPIWSLYPPIPLPSPTISFASTIRKGGR